MMKFDIKFSKDAVKAIENAIVDAYKQTSCPIFVHIDQGDIEDIWERVEIVFDGLNVAQTMNRNGVLLYVSLNDKSLFFMSDLNLNEKLSEGFFEATQNTIINYFKLAQFGAGIVAGIEDMATKLSTVFPAQAEEMPEPVVSIED